MSQRPSILSVLSPSQSSPNVPHTVLSPPKSHIARTPSIQLMTEEVDPDELFTKHTISEVRFTQHRLRADADAKQEELRLMVGERYRDLLQASSSIISISQSAKRVAQALKDSKAAIMSQEEPPLPKQQAPQGSSDSHLRALQLLSAHMKLLLDAPEHLWRLIEKRKYFTAAWLFRLSIVVHRSLVNDEGGEWNLQGLDVLEQFPLIQRQLDSINQFRQPIVHKAVQSLREYSVSAEDVCAALVPLNLLNSQPFGETFEVLLEQRTKTLNNMLLGKPTSTSPVLSRRPNGNLPEPVVTKSVSDIRVTTMTALEAITQTVSVSRTLFQETEDCPSLMSRVFEYIHSESVDVQLVSRLPEELQLTTHSILMSLPSSTHFLLLPHNVRAYKPSAPQRSSEPPSFYVTKLEQWFSQAIQTLQSAVEKFFVDLRTIKDVWHVRTAIRKWTNLSPGLSPAESVRVESMLDEVCRDRVLAIWQLTLSEVQTSFDLALDTALASITDNTDSHRIDLSPVDFLFESPLLPVASQAGAAVTLDSSFTRYKSALRKKLLGRTSLLDDVLKNVENCARTIQQDFSQVLKDEADETSSLGNELLQAYQPFAESLCTGIFGKLESASLLDDDSTVQTSQIIFVGRVANELSTSSPFIRKIGCNEKSQKEFQKKGQDLHDKIIDRWRKVTVTSLVHQHHLALRSSLKSLGHTAPSGPSSQLIESLISLSKAVQELGILHDTQRYDDVAQTVLRQFITQLVSQKWDLDDVQTRHDLVLLQRLAETQNSWSDISSLLDGKIQTLPDQTSIPEKASDPKCLASDYLARTQTLFTPLLPKTSTASASSNEKYGALLLFGQPDSDQQFTPTLQIARPSPRFGLLLIGSGSSR